MTYENITSWDNNTGFTISGSTITGDASSAVYANSTDEIKSGDSIKATWTAREAFVVGLGADPIASGLASLEWGILPDNTKWKIFENESLVWNSGDFSTYGDDEEVKITRTGDVIKYYLGGALVYTSSQYVGSGDEVYVHIATESASSNSVTLQAEIIAVVNQKLRVMFYPDNNVQNIPVNQQLRVMFYPDNRVQDIGSSSTAWKWWLGMRYGTRKRYGTSHVRRMRI